MAASRLYARKPEVVSGTSVSDAWRTTHEPSRCRRFFSGEKCSMFWVSRSPTTMSAGPSRIGLTSLGMSEPQYWLSASVLTITSAPSFSAASRPAWKPAARPLLLVRRTMWSTPLARATSMVRSVDPSSMTSHSTVSKPSTWRGRSASVAGSVASSLRQGIWMMSFMRGRAEATGRAERSTPYTRWRPVSHMASVTITRPAPGPDPATGPRRRRLSWPLVLLAALAVGTVVGFIVYPTYPNYDSYYSLLWGRELLHGVKPSFDGYRTPTEHPLAVAFGALLSILGDPADRILVGATLASFVVLAAGLYRLFFAPFWRVGGPARAGPGGAR